jgi:uncharacterized phage protein gp47/JayE
MIASGRCSVALETGFTRPTLAELIDRISDDLNAQLPGEDSRLRRSLLWILALLLAGVAHLLYGFGSWIARQILPDTADADTLDRHAAIWGLSRTPATYASVTALFTGDDGKIIIAGAEIQRLDGVQYTNDADGTIVAGSVSLSITAVEAGTSGDASIGTVLELVSPVAGVDSEGVVGIGPVTLAADEETDDDLRERILERIQDPPQGGAAADYVAWAKEIPRVDNVWVFPDGFGVGTVSILFTVDRPVGGDPIDIIPSAPKVAEVQAHIDDLRPVTAEPFVSAPEALIVPFRILVTPDTAPIREAVEAEIDNLFDRTATPGGTIQLSQIGEAISSAEGESYHTLLEPAAPVVQSSYQIAIRGAMSWS